MRIDLAHIEVVLRVGNTVHAQHFNCIRELHFENPTWSGVESLLTFLARTYTVQTTQNLRQNRRSRAPTDTYRRVRLSVSNDLLRQFDVVIRPCHKSKDTPKVSVSFYATAVIDSETLGRDFVKFVRGILLAVQAESCEVTHDDRPTPKKVFLTMDRSLPRFG